MGQEPDDHLNRREVLGGLAAGSAALAVSGPAAAQASFSRGAVIRTVLKDYAPEELAGGATLFHEHMSQQPDFLLRWVAAANDARAQNAAKAGVVPPPSPPASPPPAQPGRPFYMQDVELMASEMAAAKADGIACIVDGGHAAMGRDYGFLKQISEKSGMPIVAGGGFYAQPFYPKEIAGWSEDQVFQAIMRQVRAEAIGAFGEIGSWDYITRDERKVFRAIGRAHLASNIPIFTHTGIPGKSALEQLDIFEDVGVDPRRVCIGHLGNLVDPNAEVHKAICRRGAFVGFDRQGGAGDAQQVPVVMKLIEDGFAANLMFSSDFSSQAQLKRNNPAMGYAKTLTVFVPKMKAAGATDAVLRQIMNDNPRRFLAHVPKVRRPR